jgi:hypothetical protein
MLKKTPPLDAEAMAITALTFLAADGARLSRFLDMTGIDPADLRRLAESPAFFGAILDHLLADEALLLAFCANHHIRPEGIAQARFRLAPEASSLKNMEG